MTKIQINSLLPDLCIVGSGVCLPVHMSFETLDILNNCNSVYTIIKESDSEWFQNLVKTKTHILWHLFQDSRPRKENYHDVVNHVIEMSKKEKPVAYLTYGNPMFYDSITQELISTAHSQNLSVHVFPAISFLDTILSNLKKDPSPGINIYEATFFVTNNIQPTLDIPLLLVQIGVFDTIYSRFNFEEKFTQSLISLRDYLLKFFPETHQVTFVKTAMNWQDRDHMATYSLKDIGQVTKPDLQGTTLYIPKVLC